MSVLGTFAVIAAVLVQAAEPAIGLREFVAAEVERDLTLREAVLDRDLTAAELRAARSEFWPRLVPSYSSRSEGAGARSRHYGTEVLWDTGWGVELAGRADWGELDLGAANGQQETRNLTGEVTVPLGRRMGRLPARTRLEGAKFDADREERDLDEERQRAVLRAIGDYYRLLRARAAANLAKEAVGRAERNLRLSEMKYSLGEISRIDRDRAEQRLREARDAEVNSASDLEILVVEIGLAAGVDLAAVRTEMPDEASLGLDLELDRALALARQSRMEFWALGEQRRLAEWRLTLARREFWPDLAISWRRSELRDVASGGEAVATRDEAWFLSASVPLDLGPRMAALAGARSELLRLDLARDQAERNLQGELAGRLSAVRRASQLIANQKAALANAQSQMRVAELRFEKGLGSAFDVVDSQAQLEGAELVLLDSRIDLAQRYYELLYAVRRLEPEALVP